MSNMMQPGEHHQRLNVFAGEFDGACRMWQKPGQPPFEYTGVMKCTWEMGGRFLRQEFTSLLFGGEFIGTGYWGYNNHSGRYEGVWMDTASTIMQTETGSCDASGKVFTMSGEMTSPQGGMMTKRTVITVRSQDEFTFELYFGSAGAPEIKMIEVVYRRRE